MSDACNAKENIGYEIDRIRPALCDLSHKIHANPELGFAEHKAVQWQTELLQDHGFSIETPYSGLETSYKATFIKGTGGPAIAFLAEYDALKGLGHACGHNLIAAMAVGGAIGLAKCTAPVNGKVVVIGCPAEETGHGKVILLNNGGFDGIDFAMMIHPGNRNLIGRGGLASTRLDIEFFGKAAHSKEPAEGINALTALLNTFTGIDTLRQVWRDDARINGIITAGGVASNVIPEYAAATFTVRSRTGQYLHKMIADIGRVADAAALVTGAKSKVTTGLVSTERYPNRVMGETFKANMALLNETMTYPPAGLQVGSSDFGNVSMVIPAIHEYLAIATTEVKNHTPEMAGAACSPRSDAVLVKGAQGLAMTGHDILASAELRKRIVDEFQQTMAADRQEVS